MKILVIGIGNPGRGDDGLGPAIVAGLTGTKAEALPEGAVLAVPGRSVEAVWKYQLNIEDAHLIRDYEAVVFADASREDGEPVSFRPLRPAPAVAFTTHALAPAAVLALCEELYGAVPEARLLAVRGHSWEPADGLSAEARSGLRSAGETLASFLDSFSRT